MSVVETPKSAAGWGCTVGCLGIGLVFLFMFVMIADMIFLWPIGSVLQLGQWVYNPPHGDSDGGWTFLFDSPYDAVESGFIKFVFLLVLAGLAYLAFRKPSPIKKSRNPLYRDTPQAPETPSGLMASLQAKPPRLLVNFDSHREEKLNQGLRSLFGAPFVWAIGLHLANFLALKAIPSELLGRGATPQRFALLLAFSVPGILSLTRGLAALRARQSINDQLLFDFNAEQIFEVDLHDRRRNQRPKLLLGFGQIEKVRLLRVFRHSGETDRCELSLFANSQARPILLVQSKIGSEQKACEDLAVLLAELLNAEVEEVENTLPEPSD